MRWLGLALLSLFALVGAPVLVALAFPWANPNETSYPCMPWWLNTPDDPTADQGMYEPQVADVYHHFGWWIKTWYWLGIRNQLYGLFAALCAKYDGSKVVESTWWKLKVYTCQGFKELTWPGRRISFGYKIHTLKTAKAGDPIWWVFMPAFWRTREY